MKDEIMADFDALQKKLKDWVEESWPKEGDTYWTINTRGRVSDYMWSGVWNDSRKDLLDLDLLLRTQADAELMRDWLKAQRLTWMPAEGEGWYVWCDIDREPVFNTEWTPEPEEIATGNVHRTEEQALAYGKLQAEVANMKQQHLSKNDI
jgi:hypothetical protein